MATVALRTARRLVATVAFEFIFDAPRHSLSVIPITTQPLQRKELLFCLEVYGGPKPLDPESVNWSFSAHVGAPFCYAPETSDAGSAGLPKLTSNKGFTRVRVTPVRWLADGLDPASLISSVVAIDHQQRSHTEVAWRGSEVAVFGRRVSLR
jgi:hypothetical protein